MKRSQLTTHNLYHFLYFKIICMIIIFFSLLGLFTSFNIGHDISLKQNYFLTFKFIQPQKGDFVVIKNHNTDYDQDISTGNAQDTSFIKILAGVEGDIISVHGNDIMINGELVGKLQTHTSLSGKTLTPIKEGAIPKDYVFVIGTHERSFDGRYKEFGLVHIKNISGKTYGI